MKTKTSALLRRPLRATFLVALFIFGITAIIWLNQSSTTKSSNPYINISELPESFMSKYLSDYAEVADNNDTKKNILIVTSLEPLENTFGAKNVIEAANHQYFLVYESGEERDFAYDQIDGTPNLSVAKNALRTISEDDENGAYNSWGIKKLGLDHATELVENYPNKNEVIVAILDTGLDVNLFKENFDEDKLAGMHNVQKNSDVVSDEVGHGTHIAGTIAEGTPSNVKIYSVQMTSTREMYSSDIVAAIDYVTYYTDADVMNMSFGGYSYEEPEYLAIEAAKEKNIIGVAAAGNESTNARSYPSSFDNTISISAIDSSNQFAEFSNYGTMIDFAAPGVGILSINGTMDGTSMATPHAVATVAIAKSFKKDMTFDETISFLKTRAVDLGAKGKDNRFGWGYVDYNGAVLCTSASESCDQFSIFEIDKQVGIEIGEPVYTRYNYGSLTNILATKIKFSYASGYQNERPLGDLGTDVEITGYNPYAAGAQEITVKYEDMTATFTVENPSDWASGWRYSEYGDNAILAEYRDHGLDIKTLYLPATIDGRTIVSTYTGCMFNGNYDNSTLCQYPNSNDANYYETMVIPESYTSVGGLGGDGASSRLQNLYKIVYQGDVLELYNQAFSNLNNLVSFDGKVTFNSSNYGDWEGNEWTEYDKLAFSGDTSLEHVEIAEGVDAIPQGTFSGCTSLAHIDIPDSVKTIEASAFENSGIKSLHLSDNVENINSRAFAHSALENLYVSKSVTNIAADAFYGMNNLQSVEVDQANPVYDSRDDSNSIILTADNKLMVGAYTTIIPSTVTTIGTNSFRDNSSLYEIEISEGVQTIEPYAFGDSFYLMKVTLPRSLTSMDENAFAGAGLGTPSRTVFMVWSNSYAHNRAMELGYPYILLDDMEEEPPLIADAVFEVTPEGRSFSALETITSENFSIKIYYYDEENDKPYEEPEVITDFSVIYNGGQSEALTGGYNTVTFVFDTAKGYRDLKMDLMLFANYLIPEYEIPTGISAYSGQALSEVDLPDEFVWMNGDEFVEESKTEYLASFVPIDSANYRVIEKIPIPVTIKTGTTFAELFPDEAFRACIVDNINQQESAEYTEENIDLDKVYAITELNCANGVNGNKISNTRGIEKLTNLKTLDLSGNSIPRINLVNNEKLESLNLRSNLFTKLNIEKNTKLSELLIDSTNTRGETIIVDVATYIEATYDDDGNVHKIMNISKLDFLKDADFTIEALTQTAEEHWETAYDAETNVISFEGQGMLQYIRFTVTMQDGSTVSYVINGKMRMIYFTTYFDGVLYDEEIGLMFTYTNGRINIQDLAKDLAENFYMMSGYALEEYTIANDDDFIVGEKDVYLTFRFKKIVQDDDPGTGTDPGDGPGTGTEPDGDDTDEEPEDVPNPQTYDGTKVVMLSSIVVMASVVLIGISRRFGRRSR